MEDESPEVRSFFGLPSSCEIFHPMSFDYMIIIFIFVCLVCLFVCLLVGWSMDARQEVTVEHVSDALRHHFRVPGALQCLYCDGLLVLWCAFARSG